MKPGCVAIAPEIKLGIELVYGPADLGVPYLLGVSRSGRRRPPPAGGAPPAEDAKGVKSRNKEQTSMVYEQALQKVKETASRLATSL
jgi:hypothetical protein